MEKNMFETTNLFSIDHGQKNGYPTLTLFPIHPYTISSEMLLLQTSVARFELLWGCHDVHSLGEPRCVAVPRSAPLKRAFQNMGKKHTQKTPSFRSFSHLVNDETLDLTKTSVTCSEFEADVFCPNTL